jgi:hypothetical protein
MAKRKTKATKAAKDAKVDWRRLPRNREHPKSRDILAAKFPPPLQFRWRAGPYRPPAYCVGTVLHDEYRGDVKVEGTTDAPIPWPGATYKKGRRDVLLPILCGDLVRAVCEEDEQTVAHYWGVSFYMVEAWKRAISGAEDANGVFAGLVMKRNDPKFRKKFGYPA